MSAPQISAWLSTPNVPALEIVAAAGYDSVILDVEHGTFDLNDLERFVPLARALGLTCLVKTLAAERGPIQQALDFGADGVVIPHVLGLEHAREVSGFAKFPPLGDRSLAGGRTMGYAGFDAEWVLAQDSSTLCLPMIEHVEALTDLAAILALPTVDGLVVGPGDLFIRTGTGGYRRTEQDVRDLRAIAAAARAAGKPWMMPAWSPLEQRLALEEGAHTIAVLQEFTALRLGFEQAMSTVRQLQKTVESEE